MGSLCPIQPSGLLSPAEASSPHVFKQKACTLCRDRKVKCDRKLPCTNCVSWSERCVYPSPIRRCQRQRKGSSNRAHIRTSMGTADVATISQPLDERLNKLETAVNELKELIQKSTKAPELAANPDLAFHHPGKPSDTTRLDAIERKLSQLMTWNWTGDYRDFGPGVRFNPEGVPFLKNGPGFCPLPVTFNAIHRPLDSFGIETAQSKLTPSQLRTCWKIFVQRVDPLIKVLHKPSMQGILRRSWADTGALTKAQEALVFSVYFASISSMTIDEINDTFGLPQSTVLNTYRLVTEQALMRAGFLSNNDLITIQAVVLFLSSNFFIDETKLAWALAGAAQRLTQSSVARDGNCLSPFERELRNRLCWQLWHLDRRAIEDHGNSIDGTTWNYAPEELPLNVADAYLDPHMEHAPCSQDCWTEMSFALIRIEIARTSCRVENYTPNGVSSPHLDKAELIQRCKQHIQSRYLRYCDGSQPIHWLAQHVAHVLLEEQQFKLYYNPYSQSQQEQRSQDASPDITGESQAFRQGLFLSAIDIVDVSHPVKAEVQASEWKWLLAAYLQYQPLAFLLNELCNRYCSFDLAGVDSSNEETREILERAWNVAEDAFARNAERFKVLKNGLLLNQLMSQAKTSKMNHDTLVHMAQDWQWGETMLDSSLTPHFGYEPELDRSLTGSSFLDNGIVDVP
ncbi:hypothetical protein FQN57_006238 [Myotisia sp. PD_48]|nr:hypothetical protein FQN57_006238 [Myotisia sp. PD_48]